MIRIAAVGDLHVGEDSRGTLGPAFGDVGEDADVLLLAGDLTRCGTPAEAEVLVAELGAVNVPTLAVLGNHDLHAEESVAFSATLGHAGIEVLEGSGRCLDLPGGRLGIAGVKGFGGGFGRTAVSAFGEPELKQFVEHTRRIAERLHRALVDLQGCDVRVALLHFSPVVDTLRGEPPEIHAFLGSQLLGEAIDDAGADLALHGHAHAGVECGTTPGGVPVRNVALPVIGEAYRVFGFHRLDPRGAGRGHA